MNELGSTETTLERAESFEQSLRRFLVACRKDQKACGGFGGNHPARAFDRLLAELAENPILAGGDTGPRIDDVDLITIVAFDLISKRWWGFLGPALAEAEEGGGPTLLSEAFINLPAGNLDFASFARFPADFHPKETLGEFRAGCRTAYARYERFWGGEFCSYMPVALWLPSYPDAFHGPFTNAATSPTTVVIGTTHDPFTPYVGARRTVRELGNARLLTMDGDAHTAYTGTQSEYPEESRCIDHAVEKYLKRGKVPRRGKVCRQTTKFGTFESPFAASGDARPTVDLLRKRFGVPE
jgi:hypothetical protein